METIRLNNGVDMPQLGFGVFQIDDLEECEKVVLQALETGYRLIDTAAAYANEEAVGRAIKRSGIPRAELFLSTKVWVTEATYEQTMASFEASLEKLQTDYLDLFLIHMPLGDYHGSWRALEELYRAGRIRAIGVCNFLEDRLTDLILSHEIIPQVNQIECHPFSQRKELRQVMAHFDIRTMAWAPFAEGRNRIFTNDLLQSIGENYGKSAAQVILAWLRSENIVAIPKSVHLERIQQNFDIDDFALTTAEQKHIEALDTGAPLILDIQSLTDCIAKSFLRS